jgi:hypothetical protein
VENKPVAWDAWSAELIGWFTAIRETLPLTPFRLGSGRRIRDPEKYFSCLAADIELGPESEAAPALIHDIALLKRLFK